MNIPYEKIFFALLTNIHFLAFNNISLVSLLLLCVFAVTLRLCGKVNP